MSGRDERNVHGRRWGRGIRPYLLTAKIVGVAMFFGGLVSVLVLVLLPERPIGEAGWLQLSDQVRRAHVWVIIPGLVVAMAAGLLLLASIWRALIRMRWFQVKLALVVVCVPTLHLVMSSRSLALRSAISEHEPACEYERLCGQLIAGTLAALVFALAVMVLGRVKPRLGQDYGRTFAGRDEGRGVRGFRVQRER